MPGYIYAGHHCQQPDELLSLGGSGSRFCGIPRVSPVPLVCVLVALVQASGGYPLCAAFKKPRLQLAMITMRVAKQEKYVAIGKRLQRCASASVRQWRQRRR